MSNYRVIGKPLQRKDALEKVTGTAVYAADIFLPRMLYAAVCRSPLAHAKISWVDVSEAARVPGVRVILTGRDNPGLFGQFVLDQPVLAFDKVRYEGEPVAAVAAEDLEAAREAVRRIKVEYEPLPPVKDVLQAIEAGAPLLHQKWSDYQMAHTAKPMDGTNICDHFRLRKGDVEAGFAEADVVIEHDYGGKMLQHSTIEPHTATAQFDERGLTVWTPTQSPFLTREQLAKLFNLSLNQVRFICPQIGGGFGSKYELKCEPLAAALAMKAHGRPVKLVNTRQEEFLTGGCRGPWHIHIKTGAKKDGRLVAQETTVYWDTGAYVTTGPRISYNAGYAAVAPYKIPHVAVDGYTVVTNKHIATAYRGFGVPEVVWAYENQMDMLAERLQMDRLELRLMNALADGDESATGERLQNVGLKDCLQEAARKLNWEKNFKPGPTPEGKLRGRSITAFCKLTGTPSSSSVVIRLNGDGTLTAMQSGLEMGQGLTTVIPQIIAESLGVAVEKVMLVPVDTLYTPYEKTSTSSRLTFHVGNAALNAVKDLKEQLKSLAAIAWQTEKEAVEIRDGLIIGQDSQGNEKRLAIDDLGKSGIMKEQNPVIGRGQYSTADIFDPPDPETHQSRRPTVMWFWGAQAALVEVDPGTGQVEVKKLAAAHDIGKAINPLGLYQQIEGGLIMGLGHALLEEMIFDEHAKLLNGNMVDYKVPTSRDAEVEMAVSLVETQPHPEGPFGAKGIGEPAMAGTAAAIANAVSEAVGRRFTTLPVKADAVLEAILAKASTGKEGEQTC